MSGATAANSTSTAQINQQTVLGSQGGVDQWRFLAPGGTLPGAAGASDGPSSSSLATLEQNLHANMTILGDLIVNLPQMIGRANANAGLQTTDPNSGTGIGGSAGLNNNLNDLKDLLTTLKPPQHGG